MGDLWKFGVLDQTHQEINFNVLGINKVDLFTVLCRDIQEQYDRLFISKGKDLDESVFEI